VASRSPIGFDCRQVFKDKLGYLLTIVIHLKGCCSLGRRRKKVVRIPKKRLAKFFSCPTCGKETVKVEISRDKGGLAIAQCSSCGLKEDFQIKPAQGEVDVYCMLTDRIYGSGRRTVTTTAKKE